MINQRSEGEEFVGSRQKYAVFIDIWILLQLILCKDEMFELLYQERQTFNFLAPKIY